MCGRYELPITLMGWEDIYGLLDVEPEDRAEAPAEIRPTDPAPIVLNMEPHKLVSASWWLEGPWAADRKKLTLFNARDDKLATPFWKEISESQRCLAPASAFIEWRVVPGRKKKQAVRVKRKDGHPFAMAGLWNHWNGKLTFTLLTTSANELMTPIHDRMPVILPKSEFARWLAPEPVRIETLQSLLRPYDSTQMSAADVREPSLF